MTKNLINPLKVSQHFLIHPNKSDESKLRYPNQQISFLRA